MRSWKKKAGLAGIIVLLAAQLVPVDRSNPPVDPSKTIYALTPMPANVRSVFQGSCANCHSNETHWPWYSRVAPFSWIVAHDVHQGRRNLNFSNWGIYPLRRRQNKLESICDQLMNGEMPDSKYVFVHRDAKLTQEQKEAVCTWTQTTPD